MALGYYDGDYTPIDASVDVGSMETAWDDMEAPDLYNGNISWKINDIMGMAGTDSTMRANKYKYDQLHRIKRSEGFIWDGSNWDQPYHAVNHYETNFEYDANGNITSLKRKDQFGYYFDQLTYHYYSGTNRLEYIDDSEPAGDLATDIDDQDAGNYTYDETGNLVSDDSAYIDEIEWTVYGKVKSVTRTSGSNLDDLEFDYDANGNRVLKIVKPRVAGNPSGQSMWEYYYYLRDPSGNVLSEYKLSQNGMADNLFLEYNPIYGSDRLGTVNRNKLISSTPSTPEEDTILTDEYGYKQYELTNHLGNVLATISDRKVAVDSSSNDSIDYYLANTESAQDYYPFGWLQPGRQLNPSNYTFGYQDQYKDDEIFGSTGTFYNFTYRGYDPRIGRFISIDPLASLFAYNSPYAFCENRVIDGIELEGLERVNCHNKSKNPIIFLAAESYIESKYFIDVFAHGNEKYFRENEESLIKTTEQFDEFLAKNSPDWKNRSKDGYSMVVVMHVCLSGRIKKEKQIDEKGNEIIKEINLVREMSKENPDDIFVAPTGNVRYKGSEEKGYGYEKGIYKYLEKDPNPEHDVNELAEWVIFKGGEEIMRFSGDVETNIMITEPLNKTDNASNIPNNLNINTQTGSGGSSNYEKANYTKPVKGGGRTHK